MRMEYDGQKIFEQEIVLLIRTQHCEPPGAHLRIKCLGAQTACLHQTSNG